MRAPQGHARTPSERQDWAARTSEWDARTPDGRKLGRAQSREMRAPQVQGKIGLRAIRELQKQSGKMTSTGLAAATSEAHVFSGNLSCIFCLFTGWAQADTCNTRSHAPVERAQPKAAARRPVVSGPRSAEGHQILGCAQCTNDK